MGASGLSRARVLRAGLTTAILGIFPVDAKAAPAAEIKVLCAGALRSSMTELIPQFEQSSGDSVTVAYAPVGALIDRIQKGELADIAIVTPAQIDALQQQGTIASGSRVNITRVGIGVFARIGAPPPDISSTDAFKHALLAATALAFPTATGGPAGIYLDAELSRLGIADALKSKTTYSDVSADLFQAVARGDAELGIAQMPEIAAATNVQLAGPLPAAIQSYTSFAAGIFAGSQQPDAAKTFINFVSAHAATVFAKAKGFDAF
jgi:molybdate transport system substrate-binding protein